MISYIAQYYFLILDLSIISFNLEVRQLYVTCLHCYMIFDFFVKSKD